MNSEHHIGQEGLSLDDLLIAAQSAIARHEWGEAVTLLSDAAKQEKLSVEGYEMLGQAAWWTGDLKLCIDAREKAYVIRLNQQDYPRAGRLSLFLAEHYYYENAKAVSAYWYRLAKDLLERDKNTPEYGWFLRAEAQKAFDHDSNPQRAMNYAQQALEVAKSTGDRNLECLSLHDTGRFSMATGKVFEGLEMMEDAMAWVMSGEVEPMTSGRLFCNMIDACEQLVDYQRAVEWDTVARNWCERVGQSSGFPGVCRVRRAGIMRRRGAWKEAEKEALKAKQELVHFAAFAARAIYEVGEIRLRLGDYDKAEQAFKEAHALGFTPQPGLALLYDAQGKSKAAFELLESALLETTLPLMRVPILAAYGMLGLKSNKTEVAESVLNELNAIAEDFSSAAINAAAMNLKGLIAYTQGDYEQALETFRKTLQYWLASGLPYDVAVTRLSIANTYAKMNRYELARLEWETALREFERLGAKPDMEKVAMAMAKEAHQSVNGVKKALMFTDIVGSTALISTIGDTAWKHLVQWHDRTLRALFEQHHGHEVDHAGDGFFIEFDSPDDAVHCAQDIQRTLVKHRTTQGFAPNVRIGIHCAEVSYSDTSIVGLEVHKAARIASLADAGEIAASCEIADNVEDKQILERKSVQVKGIEGPIDIVMLDWKE